MEKDVELRYRLACKAKQVLCLKLVTPGYTGVPDRICLKFPGIVWFAEFKFKKGQLSGRQVIVHGMLRKLGFNVLLIDENNVQKYIDEI